MHHEPTRREFLKTSVGLGVGLGLSAPAALAAAAPDRAKGLPTVVYGRTGERIPRLVLGLGSRFCAIKTAEESDQLLHRALDEGLYFWDTAWNYANRPTGVVSEERIARVLATRRKEAFISTKVAERDPAKVRAQVEHSLRRLGIDRLDQLLIHSITTPEDAAKVLEKGGVADQVYRLKEEGLCRYVGFSGHTSAAALRMMVERGNFDGLLMALNHYDQGKEPRQQQVLPAARAKGMGVLVMKVIRPREKDASLTPTELLRYALTLEEPHALTVGTDSLAVLEANLALLRNFQPLPAADMKRLAAVWRSLDRAGTLPWTQPGYHDGAWA
jgi:uncharacterized protein